MKGNKGFPSEPSSLGSPAETSAVSDCGVELFGEYTLQLGFQGNSKATAKCSGTKRCPSRFCYGKLEGKTTLLFRGQESTVLTHMLLEGEHVHMGFGLVKLLVGWRGRVCLTWESNSHASKSSCIPRMPKTRFEEAKGQQKEAA